MNVVRNLNERIQGTKEVTLKKKALLEKKILTLKVEMEVTKGKLSKLNKLLMELEKEKITDTKE